MSNLFSCKTTEAFQIKVLSELMTHNMKNGWFEFSPSGISSKMFDQARITLIDLNLQAENFISYHCSDTLNIGFNLGHFHKMMKLVKKKDSLQLIIPDNNQSQLDIKTIPKESTKLTTSSIRFYNMSRLDIDLPTGYEKPVLVQSQDFQKMCKELLISPKIIVESYRYYIDFIADADGIMKRKIRLGEQSDQPDTNPIYKATFTSDQFSRIIKLSGLSQTIQIYTGTNGRLDMPLLFKTNVGTLGKISVYIKSKEMLEYEACNDSGNDDNSSDLSD